MATIILLAYDFTNLYGHGLEESIFSKESKDFLQGQELTVAKEMIRAGIESVSGNVSDLDDFFDKQRENFSKKQTIIH